VAERDYGAMSRADLVALVRHLEDQFTEEEARSIARQWTVDLQPKA
jgi:hypothetical protein